MKDASCGPLAIIVSAVIYLGFGFERVMAEPFSQVRI
jgi:hypothetical protein